MDSTIKTFVDNGIEWLRQKELLMWPDPNMPTEMLDTTRKSNDDWKPWKPIGSTATDVDIETIEKQIGHLLPNSYKAFLKYKHFYSIHSVDKFEPFEHVVHRWTKVLTKKYFHPELKQYMLDKGFIWFGAYEDWGFLCFDTNNKAVIDNEYPVILIDHETIEEHQVIYKDFNHCLQKNTWKF